MKIEIDLNEILGGGEDYGPETLQESIRRQVIEKITYDLKGGIAKKIDEEVQEEIARQISKAIESITPTILNELMDAEYVPVDTWGSKSKAPTTFRIQLAEALKGQIVYKSGDRYGDGKNHFSKIVDDVVKANVETFKKEFNSLVNKKFVDETMAFAIATLKERLKL